jgi:hypothetical protein
MYGPTQRKVNTMKRLIAYGFVLCFTFLAFVSHSQSALANNSFSVVYLVSTNKDTRYEIKHTKENIRFSTQGLYGKPFEIGVTYFEEKIAPFLFPFRTNVEDFIDDLDHAYWSPEAYRNYGLDALAVAADQYVFMANSSKYFVLVTNSDIQSLNDAYSLWSLPPNNTDIYMVRWRHKLVEILLICIRPTSGRIGGTVN